MYDEKSATILRVEPKQRDIVQGAQVLKSLSKNLATLINNRAQLVAEVLRQYSGQRC